MLQCNDDVIIKPIKTESKTVSKILRKKKKKNEPENSFKISTENSPNNEYPFINLFPLYTLEN